MYMYKTVVYYTEYNKVQKYIPYSIIEHYCSKLCTCCTIPLDYSGGSDWTTIISNGMDTIASRNFQ